MVDPSEKQEHSMARKRRGQQGEASRDGVDDKEHTTRNNRRSSRSPLKEGWPALAAPGP